MVNRNELRVVGMSRSGNHAIINWILEQIEGRFCFLNCVEPKTNPFRSARPFVKNRKHRTNDDGFDLKAAGRGAFREKDYLIYNYEDCFLGMVNSDVFEQYHDAWVGPSERRQDVLILRDPFNLFASRQRVSYPTVTPATAVRIWKQHAREFAGRRRYLSRDRLVVSYNRWVQDRAYRRQLAEALGLVFTDAGRDAVARCGQGSSFDRRRYDGQARQMKVLERWRHFADDPAYRQLFDSDMVALSDEIFGVLPGTEAIAPRASRRQAA